MSETPAEEIGNLIPSGHCSFPVTDNPTSSHDRCTRNGGGSRANPTKTFMPCSCACHLGEEFECGGCGRTIREALLWPFDEDGDLRYTHVDERGWATGEECYSTKKVSRNTSSVGEPPTKDCVRCGAEFTGNSSNGVCPKCTAAEAPEDDFSDLGDEDDDLDALLADLDDMLD